MATHVVINKSRLTAHTWSPIPENGNDSYKKGYAK